MAPRNRSGGLRIRLNTPKEAEIQSKQVLDLTINAIRSQLPDPNNPAEIGQAVLEFALDKNPYTAIGRRILRQGLKTIYIRKTKEMANGNLQSTDWYVTRKAEAGTAIPSDVATYRAAVRTASKTIEDKINACSDLTEFKALFDTPVDGSGNPTGKAPIYDFPDSVT